MIPLHLVPSDELSPLQDRARRVGRPIALALLDGVTRFDAVPRAAPELEAAAVVELLAAIGSSGCSLGGTAAILDCSAARGRPADREKLGQAAELLAGDYVLAETALRAHAREAGLDATSLLRTVVDDAGACARVPDRSALDEVDVDVLPRLAAALVAARDGEAICAHLVALSARLLALFARIEQRAVS